MTNSEHRQLQQLPNIGDVVDERYKLLERFAAGGMGVVMKAEQIRTGRLVAMKLLHPHIAAKEDFQARFLREARTSTLFDHPNIVRVYDVGATKDGILYLVMEFLVGQELEDLIAAEAPLPAARAMTIGLQMLDGLAEAHRMDIIHRDFKPANVFIGENRRGEDRVKLLDFGIAKALHSQETQLTATGMVTGTPAYIAPETLVDSELKNPRAIDVYAAGLVLLEMLTGKRCFEGNSLAHTLMMQLNEPVRIPRAIAETPLGAVIQKATAKHPDDRYADADHMYRALLEARAGTPDDLCLANVALPDRIPAESSQSLLRRMADTGHNTTLDMLRKAPQHQVLDSSHWNANVDDISATAFSPAPTFLDAPEEQQPQGRPESTVETPQINSSNAAEPAFPTFITPPADSSKRKPKFIALLLGGLVVICIVVLALIAPDSPVAEDLTTEVTVPMEGSLFGSQQDSDFSQIGSPIEDQEGPGEEEVVAEEPPLQERSFSVETTPEGATIWQDNRVLGRTPLDRLSFPSQELPVTLRFELQGYETQTITVDVATEAISLTLTPTPRASPSTRAAPTPTPRPQPAPTPAPAPSADPTPTTPSSSGVDLDDFLDQTLPID